MSTSQHNFNFQCSNMGMLNQRIYPVFYEIVHKMPMLLAMQSGYADLCSEAPSAKVPKLLAMCQAIPPMFDQFVDALESTNLEDLLYSETNLDQNWGFKRSNPKPDTHVLPRAKPHEIQLANTSSQAEPSCFYQFLETHCTPNIDRGEQVTIFVLSVQNAMERFANDRNLRVWLYPLQVSMQLAPGDDLSTNKTPTPKEIQNTKLFWCMKSPLCFAAFRWALTSGGTNEKTVSNSTLNLQLNHPLYAKNGFLRNANLETTTPDELRDSLQKLLCLQWDAAIGLLQREFAKLVTPDPNCILQFLYSLGSSNLSWPITMEDVRDWDSDIHFALDRIKIRSDMKPDNYRLLFFDRLTAWKSSLDLTQRVNFEFCTPENLRDLAKVHYDTQFLLGRSPSESAPRPKIAPSPTLTDFLAPFISDPNKRSACIKKFSAQEVETVDDLFQLFDFEVNTYKETPAKLKKHVQSTLQNQLDMTALTASTLAAHLTTALLSKSGAR